MTTHTIAELLAASDSELDRIAAVEVMGWTEKILCKGTPNQIIFFIDPEDDDRIEASMWTPTDPKWGYNHAAMLRAKIAERGLHNVYVGKLIELIPPRVGVLIAWDCANASPREQTITCILVAQEKQ